MYLGNEDIHNIFWSAGIDSTFLVCRRLIIEKEPIQTYYFNFECDGYYKPYPKGRASREVEIKVMKKLRELIIKKFPYTEDLFPSLILVDEFPIHNIIYKKMRVLHEKYGYGYRLIDQNLYMVLYSLMENKIFEYPIEDYSMTEFPDSIPVTKLLKENFKDFKIENPNIPEIEIYKNIRTPNFLTDRYEMIKLSEEYGFREVIENTWSCRWPKSNGDICGFFEENEIGCNPHCHQYNYAKIYIQTKEEVQSGLIRYYRGKKYNVLQRKINYKDILND